MNTPAFAPPSNRRLTDSSQLQPPSMGACPFALTKVDPGAAGLARLHSGGHSTAEGASATSARKCLALRSPAARRAAMPTLLPTAASTADTDRARLQLHTTATACPLVHFGAQRFRRAHLPDLYAS